MSSSRFIKHDGPVRDYYDAFVPFASKVGWNGLYGVSMFILGLEIEMARMVSMFNPKTLYDTYCLAILQESTNNLLRKRCNNMLDVNSAGLDVNHCLENKGNKMATNSNSDENGEGFELLENCSLDFVKLVEAACDDKLDEVIVGGNDLESNESSEEVNWVVIVDKFVHNDGNSGDIEGIWKWFKGEKASSTCFKQKKQRVE
nr:hypothetical protein [Tanacetum cinerariifolium]